MGNAQWAVGSRQWVVGSRQCAAHPQSRELLNTHWEAVGAHPHDRMQQHHAGRGRGKVYGGIVVAEVEVVEEGAIGVLDREVTLGKHEVEEGRVVCHWLRHLLELGLG